MKFRYKALKNNKIITESIEAETQDAVLKYLKLNKLFPIEIKSALDHSASPFDKMFNKVNFNDVVNLTRQIAIMLNAGLTLVDSFEILKKQIVKEPLLKLVTDLDKEVKGGSNFSSALKKYPQYFSNLYIALVKSGEATGKLSEILLRLSENLEKQRNFKGKIKNAMIYPVMIIIAMIGVMFVMVTFVVPKLLNLYKDFNIELPMSTKILMGISSFTTRFWPIIIGLVFALSTGFKSLMKTYQGKLFFDKALLKMPVVGKIIKIAALVDVTRTLSILINAGVSILDGLKIVIDTSENLVYRDSFRNIYRQVEKGLSLGDALRREEIFPPILVQMTMVGEQTGHLDETLLRISRYFESESELAVKAMTSLIEPLILVVLGIGVGFLVLSVITPIYNLTSSFK